MYGNKTKCSTHHTKWRILLQPKEALAKKAKEESPRSHTKNGKAIPEGVTTKKKIKWSKTTEKEINKLSKKQTSHLIHLMIF